ncbi:hypothetical protein CWO89_12715 [Bradyrhizobium sp. Leo170]|nr:hypothetical protein CWO89_12715 [Bradyrhizobium sp. Leo170]
MDSQCAASPATLTRQLSRCFGELPLALAFSRHSPRDIINRVARKEGVKLSPLFEIDSLHLMKKTIATLGIYSILPRLACAAELESGQLAATPLPPPCQLLSP